MSVPAPVPVLVTGFEPFDGESLNPAWEAARALDGWRFDFSEGGEGRVAQVHARCLPCAFGQAQAALDEVLDAVRPHRVLCLGQAGGRSEITPERVAINVDDARIPDNLGRQPVDRPVVAGAPAAYFSTLPIKSMVHGLREAGIPAAVSNSAGTFVCNHLFFALMHRLATRPPAPGARGGFVHIPYLPAQAARLGGGLPSLDLETLVRGLRVALRIALEVREDRRETGGALH